MNETMKLQRQNVHFAMLIWQLVSLTLYFYLAGSQRDDEGAGFHHMPEDQGGVLHQACRESLCHVNIHIILYLLVCKICSIVIVLSLCQ